jgi:hypothetical protein
VDIDQVPALGRRLMARHGLVGWRLVLDGARTRAGVCRPARREIGVSRVLAQLHTEAEVTDTLLHEIAHALVGAEHGHDAAWRATAVAIGASGARCVPPDAARPPAPWVGTCPAGHTCSRYRRPQRPVSCARCSPRFDAGAVLEWRRDGQPVAMGERYEAELAAVRERSVLGAPDLAAGGPHGSAAAARGLLPVGALVRLSGRGRLAGLVGQVERTARTRYHVRTPLGLVTAPFALVVPVPQRGVSRRPGS